MQDQNIRRGSLSFPAYSPCCNNRIQALFIPAYLKSSKFFTALKVIREFVHRRIGANCVRGTSTKSPAFTFSNSTVFIFCPSLLSASATILDCFYIFRLGSCRSFLLYTLRKMFSEKLCPTAHLKPEDFLKMRPAFRGFLSVLRISSLCPPYPIALCAVSALYLTLSATIVFPRSNSL